MTQVLSNSMIQYMINLLKSKQLTEHLKETKSKKRQYRKEHEGILEK